MNKTILIALAGALLLSATALLFTKSSFSATNDSNITPDVVAQWKAYKSTYGLKFADPATESYRIGVFADNLQTIKNDKSGNLGITIFADLTQEEFAATYLTLQVDQSLINETASNTVSDVEINVNWVTAGAVTEVKNQGQCGSCWSFSTTGSFESALILDKQANNTLNLSEQQLVDCSKWNNGCNGGMMDRAFKYIKRNGLTTESNYPYTAAKGACQKPTTSLYHLNGFQDVTSGSVDDLKTALLQQPVSIAVDASNWSLYTNGVFDNCATSLNHGVLLVGFENGAWLVKNSWGTSWGEAGYIRLADGNTCGLANVASYPTV